MLWFHFMAPGRFVSVNCCEISFGQMMQDRSQGQSTLVQVMAWCHEAPCHYLIQCWPSSMAPYGVTNSQWVNTLRPRQNGRHFADDIFKWIFLNENVWLPIEISLKFVPQDPINNIPALVQIMACRRPGDKPLSGPMMVRLPTHICVTRPQWVNHFHWWSYHSILIT